MRIISVPDYLKRPGWLIVLFWLAAMCWLIRYEAFPEWFAGHHQSYRDIFRSGLFIMDSWMRVSLDGRPAGYTHTWVDSETAAGRQLFRVRNQTALSIRLLGQPRALAVNIGATLDDDYRLLDFNAVLRADEWQTRIEGRAVGPERFHVVIRTADAVREMDVTVPADALLHTPLTELLVGRLAPGQSLALRVFNPLTMGVEDVRVVAVARETLRLDGRDHAVTLIKTYYQGLEMRAWVDDQGRTLRQETPFGLTMELCAPADARLPEGGGPAADMPDWLGGWLHAPAANPAP